jgi:hypothetical protein
MYETKYVWMQLSKYACNCILGMLVCLKIKNRRHFYFFICFLFHIGNKHYHNVYYF